MKLGTLWSTVYRNNLRYTGVRIRIRDCLNSLLTESSPPLPITSVFSETHEPTMVYLQPHQKYKNISLTARVTFIKNP